MSTPRKLTLLATTIGLLAVIALTLLAGTDVISVTASVLLGAIAVMLACQILTVMSVRRVDGKALRVDNRVKRYEAELAQVKTVTMRLDQRLDEIVELLGKLELKRDEDLREIMVSLGEDRLTSLPRRQELEETVHALLPRLEAVEARIRAEGKA
jgi:hypothetical protein